MRVKKIVLFPPLSKDPVRLINVSHLMDFRERGANSPRALFHRRILLTRAADVPRVRGSGSARHFESAIVSAEPSGSGAAVDGVAIAAQTGCRPEKMLLATQYVIGIAKI